MANWKWCLEDENGEIIKGWYQDKNGKWYYLKENGTMATGWIKDRDDKWYYLDSDGVMQIGWKYIDGYWYYLNSVSNGDQGAMQTGWFQYENKWYYLEIKSDGYKGKMYSGGTYIIDGKNYTFKSDGELIESLVSDKIIEFIKSFEGFSATPYYDVVGVKTLGYGMTGEEIEGISSVTEEQATNMLKDWINNKYAPVIKASLDSKGITLKQNEFDALVSMAYNVGTAGILSSTLYKNICEGIRDSSTIIANFQAWSNAGGKRLEGLYRRRTKEANIFLYGDYTGNN